MKVMLRGQPCGILPIPGPSLPKTTVELEPKPNPSMILKICMPKPPRQPQPTKDVIQNPTIYSIKGFDNIRNKDNGTVRIQSTPDKDSSRSSAVEYQASTELRP